jgi:hypothetical protein
VHHRDINPVINLNRSPFREGENDSENNSKRAILPEDVTVDQFENENDYEGN